MPSSEERSAGLRPAEDRDELRLTEAAADEGERRFDAWLVAQDTAMTDTCHKCGRRKAPSRWPLCPACHGARIGSHALREP